MPRYKITIQYDGTDYFGWQMQVHERTIQAEIEKALAPLNNDDRVQITGAGRTDTGVHAYGQVAHFDLHTNLKNNELVQAINARLPQEIRILDAVAVDEDFHARFSARKRHYSYQCYLGSNILFKNQSWLVDNIKKSELDLFANRIIGRHDFLSFSKLNKKLDNTVCDIYQSEWIETENMLTFNICGNRFLHHMVRYLVGTMIAGAKSKISIDYFCELLENPNKEVKIYKAPPEGLILIGIDYNEEI